MDRHEQQTLHDCLRELLATDFPGPDSWIQALGSLTTASQDDIESLITEELRRNNSLYCDIRDIDPYNDAMRVSSILSASRLWEELSVSLTYQLECY
jgi:hypothetical protein